MFLPQLPKNMIIFIYGEDSYRSRQKLNEIINHYKEIHKSGLALAFFDFKGLKGESGSHIFSEIKNKISQVSLFSDEKKLLVISSIFSDKILKEEFLKEADNFQNSKDIMLIYENSKIDERDGLFKFLKKNTKCQGFKLLEGTALKSWIKKEFEQLKAKIEEPAFEKFFSYITSDLWQTANEIKKLFYFRKGLIKKEDIDILIKPKIETDIFKTIEAISRKEKGAALKLLQKHIENGDSPLYLLSMINFQFRNLLIVKDLAEKNVPYFSMAQKSGLHPFVVRKSWEISRNFRMQELKKIYRKIFEADYNIKTGRQDPETALEILIAEI